MQSSRNSADSQEEIPLNDSVVEQWESGSVNNVSGSASERSSATDGQTEFDRVAARKLFSEAALYLIVTYMFTTGPALIATESFGGEKTLALALTMAVIAPWPVDYVKQMLNYSGALKKDFDINWRADAYQTAIMAIYAVGFYFSYNALGKSKAVNNLGFRAFVSVAGALLKIAHDFILPHLQNRLRGFAAVPLLDGLRRGEDDDLIPQNAHAGQWYNSVAMHGGIRIPLIFCALLAGGELLGETLAPMLELFRIDKFAGEIAFSVEFNEAVGGTLFWGAEWFKTVEVRSKLIPTAPARTISIAYPNYVTTAALMFGMAYAFQAWSPAQSPNALNTLLNYIPAIALDILVRHTPIAAIIDRTVEDVSGYVLSKMKACLWQPAPGDVVVQADTYTPLASNA